MSSTSPVQTVKVLKKIPQEKALLAMRELETSLKSKHEKDVLVAMKTNELLRELRAPSIVTTGANLQIMKEIAKLHERPKEAGFPALIKFEAKDQDDPFDVRRVPPYDYQWVSGGGDGQYSASANEHNGTINLAAAAFNQNCYADGGVGIWFVPPRDMLIKFQPFIPYNYFWLDQANFVNASSNAFFGIKVQVFNSEGTNVDDIDLRYGLWNDTAGWVDTHTSGNSWTGATINEAPSVQTYSGFGYIFWTWFGVEAYNGWECISESDIQATVSSMIITSSD